MVITNTTATTNMTDDYDWLLQLVTKTSITSTGYN